MYNLKKAEDLEQLVLNSKDNSILGQKPLDNVQWFLFLEQVRLI
jgi:hypothetical protein